MYAHSYMWHVTYVDKYMQTYMRSATEQTGVGALTISSQEPCSLPLSLIDTFNILGAIYPTALIILLSVPLSWHLWAAEAAPVFWPWCRECPQFLVDPARNNCMYARMRVSVWCACVYNVNASFSAVLVSVLLLCTCVSAVFMRTARRNCTPQFKDRNWPVVTCSHACMYHMHNMHTDMAQ